MRKINKSLFITLCSIIVIIGAIFRIQHWPGGNILMLVGLVSYLVLIMVYYKPDKVN